MLNLIRPLAATLLLIQSPPAAPQAPAPAAEPPDTVVRRALAAVEGDSVAPLLARWSARLARDAGDRAAALGLATLSRLTYDYADAERRYAALYNRPEAYRDPYAAHARVGMADGLETRGVGTGLGEMLERGLAEAMVAGDRGAAVDALVHLAFVRARTGGMPRGLATLDSAARLVARDDLVRRSAVHCRRAVLLAVLARPAAGEARTGLQLARQAGHRRAQVRCIRAAALDLELRAQPDSAVVLLRQAEQLARQARDRSVRAEVLLRLGGALRAGADFGAAKAAFDAALVEARASNNELALGSANTSYGALALQLNDYVAAAGYLRTAASMFEAQGDTGSAMTARQFLTDLNFATGDLARARALAVELLAWWEHVGEVVAQIEMHRMLAAIAVRERDWATAERELGTVRVIARRHDVPEWLDAILVDQARLALARGDLSAAERHLDRYIAGLAPDAHVLRHEARNRRAEVYARRGELARAERELAAAGDALDAGRATLVDRELRLLAFQANSHEMSGRNTSVPTVLAALASNGRAAAAFELLERRRGRELADQLTQAGALTGQQREPAPGDSTVRAVARADTARRAVRVSAADVAAALPDDRTALLEYVAGPGAVPTTLFVVTRAGVRARLLPPADSFAPLAARFTPLLESGADPRALARALGAALLDSAVAAVGPGVTRLVIVPDGVLHRIPFDALRLADGRYAVERFEIANAPSAGVAAALWRRRTAPAGDAVARVLALGDPQFAPESAAGAGEAYRSAFAEAGGLPRLVASGEEVRAVARYAPGAVVRLRGWATESFLKGEALAPYRVLHLATHALVDERSLARTAIALAPGGGEDGFLTPGELAALDLRADLVVLSACRTAGGVVVTGEGVEGLTSPLLEAGARSIVATGWRIDDRRTVALVSDLYGALARGQAVGEALRTAKLAAVARGATPAEWAAFTVVGDALVTVPLTEPPAGGRWWTTAALLGALGAGGGALAVRWRRVRRRAR